MRVVYQRLLFWNSLKTPVSELHPQFLQMQILRERAHTRTGFFVKRYSRLVQFMTRESTWLTFIDSKIPCLSVSLTENSAPFLCDQQKRAGGVSRGQVGGKVHKVLDLEDKGLRLFLRTDV